MTAIASARRSSYGMSCVRCDNELIAPEWTEHRNERHIRHFWQCGKCHCRFETVVGHQDDDGRFRQVADFFVAVGRMTQLMRSSTPIAARISSSLLPSISLTAANL